MKADFVLYYKEHYRKTFYYVYRFIPAVNDVEDVTSEIFLAIWKSWDELVKRNNTEAFLYRVTSNKINDFLRRKYKVEFKEVAFNDFLEYQGKLDTETVKKQSKVLKYVWEQIAKFKTEDAKLMNLKYCEGLTFSKVAENLGITENNAKVRHNRLIKKIKELCKTII